ncbi:MAG: VCBS repeat-containing protein [Sphingobacterium sp.]|nr:VCBS repeat-containing protein [Sphingobacterium sp.]
MGPRGGRRAGLGRAPISSSGRSRVRRQPADFSIDGSTFIVLDKQKRELWRKDTGAEDLQSEEFYRANFQIKHADQGNILPSLVMRDINGDGDTEVLFALKRERDQTGEGSCSAIDRLGSELWTFKAAGSSAADRSAIPPTTASPASYVHDIDGDGRLETVVESFHAPDWPCQLALLDADGKVIGEFWNAGYLRDLTYQDINGDGREELIVCGVNNEYKGGCLMVFDPRNIARRLAPERAITPAQDIEPGDRCSITSPRPIRDVSAGRRRPRLKGFSTGRDHRERLDPDHRPPGADLRVRLRPCVRPGQLRATASSWSIHEMAGPGAITSVLGDELQADASRAGVRYWNGSAWTAEPSMSR